MPLVYLNVPFEEKDAAKGLGAKWDAQRKLWYVPDGINPNRFTTWLPNQAYLIAPIWAAKSSTSCWKCGKETAVFSLVSSQLFEAEEEDGEAYVDLVCEDRIYVSDLSSIDPRLEQLLKRHMPGYQLDYSNTQQARVWMNHCEHCSVKQGDFYLHHEPGGAFFPTTDDEESKISLIEIASTGQFEFVGSYGLRG